MPLPRQDEPLTLPELPPQAPVQVAPSEPPEQPKSVTGFIENFWEDAFETGKAIGQAIVFSWPTAIKAGYEILSDPKGIASLFSSPEHLTHELKETGKAIVNAVIEPYKKHGAAVVYYRPIGTLLDVLTLWDLGAGSIAKVGKLAGGTGKVARAGRAASFADRTLDAGEALRKMPLSLAGKAADRIYGMVGIDRQARQKTIRYGAESEARGHVVAQDEDMPHTVAASKLKPAEHEIYDRFSEEGYSHADRAAYPQVAQAVEQFRPLAERLWKPVFTKYGLLNEATAHERLVKAAALSIYKEINAETTAAAEAHIADIAFKPVYRPHIFERAKYGAEHADSFHDITVGKASRLEEFKGMPGFITDPAVWMPRAVRDFRQIEGRLRYIDQVMQDSTLVLRATLHKGYGEDIPTYGIYKKYFENVEAKAQAVYLRDLGKRLGISPEAARQRALSDPAILAELKAVRGVEMNPTARRILQHQFYRPGGIIGPFLQKYDTLLNFFRFTATRLNPKWYLGQMVGDAILAVEAGATHGNIRRAASYADQAPYSLRAVGPLGEERLIGSWMGKFNEKTKLIDGVDQAAKMGIFDHKVAEELQRAGVLVFDSAEKTLQVIRETVVSQRELADLRVQTQQMTEAFAGRVPGIQAARERLLSAQRDLAIAKAAASRPELAAMTRVTPKGRVSVRVVSPQATQARRAQAAEAVTEATGRVVAATGELEQLMAGVRGEMQALAIAEKRIPGLAEKAEFVARAEDYANLALSSYLFLGPLERQWMRRLVPFYSWIKAQTVLAFKIPFLRPKSQFMWNRYAAAMQSLVGDPELPDYMAPYFPVFARENGSTVWVRLAGGLIPQASLRTEAIGDIPVPNIVAFWKQNPFISLGFRAIGGRDEFSASVVPSGEPMVSMGDGSVSEFTEDGKLRKTIPQMPAISGLMHMFPQVQMIETLLAPYEVTQHDYIGFPKPVLNYDGTYRYPRELWQQIVSALVIPVKDRKREDIIAAERRRVFSALRQLQKQYRWTTDPERRRFIAEVFRDYQRGAYRRIEASR